MKYPPPKKINTIIIKKKKKIIPGQHRKSLGCFLHTQGVLIEHINGWDEETSPGHIISVKVTVGDGTEQVIVLSGQSSAADGHSQFVHKLLQGVNIDLEKRNALNGGFEKEEALQTTIANKNCHKMKCTYLDSVLRIIATPVHVETRVHAAAEVAPLGDGTGDREAHHGRVVHAALVQGPVAGRLDGMRPELEHAGGDQAQQHQREQGDVVDAMLGLHPRDERGAPRAVLPSGVHACGTLSTTTTPLE